MHMYICEGTVVLWLVCSIRVQALAGDIVLCSWLGKTLDSLSEPFQPGAV